MSRDLDGLIPGPDGWWLAPEGALIHRAERVAVIADVHLGYEWSRGSGGDVIPAHSLAETTARLATLLGRAPVARLIVAGDLVESPRPCRRTADDLRRLGDWLANRGVGLELVLGNHDPQRHPTAPLSVDLDGWTIGHGHRPIPGPKTIQGHEHPVLREGRTVARCLLVGPNAIILPAFTDNAAGRNVADPSAAATWGGRSLRCWAGIRARLFDFGPVDDLHRRLARSSRPGERKATRSGSASR